jgi:hypothetical protein
MAAKTKSIKSPVDAVQVMFDALEPLDVDARQRVISSVLSLFGMPPSVSAPAWQSQPVGNSQRGTDLAARMIYSCGSWRCCEGWTSDRDSGRSLPIIANTPHCAQ